MNTEHVGKKVVKKSGKPFKSGEKVATIKSTIKHPILLDNILAFTFVEDDSHVRTDCCKFI